MNVVFMGTPDFAIPSLKKIIESKHKVLAVVTAPDKERGRGRQLSFTPIKNFAFENNIKVFTPVFLKDEKFINEIKELSADIFVVVAFRILPQEIFTIPPKGTFNLHGSLLPMYRGAAPIQWALINGEKETGVTTFFLEQKVDTGNIILQKKIEIKEDDDFGSLHDKMMILGADAVMETIELIDLCKVSITKQNESSAPSAPKITKEICEIDWNKSAEQIHNLVRGLSPYPGAFFTINNKSYKIFKTNFTNKIEAEIKSSAVSSESRFFISKKEIFVKAGNGLIQILEIQPEGRKKMKAEEFIRGYSF